MNNPKIKSLQELKEWNEANSKGIVGPLPVVLEWFMDWFFDDLLIHDKLAEAKEAYQIIIDFGVICNVVTEQQAKSDVDSNLRYWNKRTGKDCEDKLKEIGVNFIITF
jgi:hypothetical protein